MFFHFYKLQANTRCGHCKHMFSTRLQPCMVGKRFGEICVEPIPGGPGGPVVPGGPELPDRGYPCLEENSLDVCKPRGDYKDNFFFEKSKILINQSSYFIHTIFI